jgi:NADPH:quinone reductase
MDLEADHPRTRRAARYATSGKFAGELQLVDLPWPECGLGQVLVRMKVSGVNPTDWKARRFGHLAFGMPEVIPNQDGAGVIEAVGAGVDPGRVGERVWLFNAQFQRSDGTATQAIAIEADQAVKLGDEVSFEVGAGLGIPAMTAHRCLFAGADLASRPLAGAAVLVHGGAGAVGHAAIELARWAGARVATTVSSEGKAALARDAGAELVVNYRNENVAALVRDWAPRGIDRVVEVNLPANLNTDIQVLSPGGIVAVYTQAEHDVHLPGEMLALNAEVRFVLVYNIPSTAHLQAARDITRALDAGALTGLPEQHFALDEIAAAHDAVESGFIGKVLVDIP